MDETSSPISPVPSTTQPSVQEQIDGIRTITTILLAVVVCMAGALSVYLYRQASLLNRQVTEGKRMVSEFETNTLPRFSAFVNSLQNFSKSNPDFAPILAKYPLQASAAPARAPMPAAPSAPAPAPKTTAPAKK